MADEVNASINIEVDAQAAISQLRALQNTINSVNKSILRNNAEAVTSQKQWTGSLLDSISRNTQFTASIKNVESSVSRLSRSIEKGDSSLSLLRQSFKRYNADLGASNDIHRVAEQRAKNLQTQYLALGDSVNGVSKTISLRPLAVFNADAAVNAQRMQLMGRLLDNGSTKLLNWGKNTQWAGRQLTVGLGVPLTIFGAAAAKIFTDLEKSTVAFRRVYGDLGVSDTERDAALAGIQELGKEYTKYGIAVADTIDLASKAAAAGFEGAELTAQTEQATRLATLGQIDYQQALTATITLNSAFGVSAEELGEKINFLNAAENQTVLSLDDITKAIPRVGPVVRQLGGGVEELAILMTALREGGVTAEQGANAIKSGLASLINPTNKAVEVLKKYGINIKEIIKANEGDLLGTVQATAKAFDELSGTDRQRALETTFGKFQYARIGALFDNINKSGSQASKTMELMGYSTEELASIADGELSTVEQAISVKFTAALEKAKLAIAPIGEQFLKIATPVLEFIGKIAEKFNDLPDFGKTFIVIGAAIAGVVVPAVITLIGLFANFVANGIKGLLSLLRLLKILPKATDFQTEAEQRAVAATASLESATERATSATLGQKSAIAQLNEQLERYITLAGRANSSMFRGGSNPAVGASVAPPGFASGGMVGGTGNKDTEPALLTPGEFVMNPEASKKYGPILTAMNKGAIAGYITGRNPRITRGATYGGSFDIGVDASGQRRSIEAYGAPGVLDNLSDAIERLVVNGNSAEQILDLLNGSLDELGDEMYYVKGGTEAQLRRSAHGEAGFSLFSGAMQESHIGGVASEIRGAEAIRVLSRSNIAPELVELERTVPGAIKSLKLLGNAKLDLPELFNQTMKESGVGVRGETFAKYFREMLDGPEADAAIAKMFAPLEEASGQVFSPEVRRSMVTQLQKEFAASPDILYKDTADAGAGIQAFGDVFRSSASSVGPAAQGVVDALDATQQQIAHIRASLDYDLIAAAGLNPAHYAKYQSGSSGTATVRLTQAQQKAVRTGVETGTEMSSPPPWSIKLGQYISQGIEQGAVSGARDIGAKVKAAFAATEGQFLLPGGVASPYVPGRVNDPEEAHRLALIENTQRLNDSSVKLDQGTKQQGRFKGALKRNALKMQGAFFALDGLAFGLTFLDGQIGQMAQSILPAIFGIQSLSAILPLLANPIGLAIGALVAVGAGLWFLNKSANDAAKASAEYAKVMLGSRDDIKRYSEALGTVSNIDKQNKKILERETGTKISEEDVGQAASFIQSEVGQQLIERVTTARGAGGVDEAAKSLSQNLARQIAAGTISADLAKAIAFEVSKAVGDQEIGIDAAMSINEIVGPNGQDYLKDPLRITGILALDGHGIQEAMENAGFQWDGSGWWAQATMIVKGEGTVDLFAEQAAATGVEKLRIIEEGQASLNEAIDQGTISGKELIEQINKLGEIRSTFDTNEILEQSKALANFKFGEGTWTDTQTDKFYQAIINSFSQISLETLGAEKGKEFLNGIEEGFELNRGDIRPLDNWLDPEKIDDALQTYSREFNEAQQNLADLRSSGASDREIGLALTAVKETKEDLDLINRWAKDFPSAMDAVASGLIKVKEGMGPKELLDEWESFKNELPSGQWLRSRFETGTPIFEAVFGKGSEVTDEMKDNLAIAVGEVSSAGGDIDDVFEIVDNNLQKTIVASKKIGKVFDESFSKLPKKQQKDFILKLATDTFNWDKSLVDWFSGLSIKKQKEFLLKIITQYETYGTPSKALELAGGDVSAARWYGRMSPEQMAAIDFEREQENAPDSTSTTDSGTTGSGGGSKELSWIEQLLKDSEATLKLAPALMNQIRKLPNIPLSIIESLGYGEEGLDKAEDLLKLGQKKQKELFNKVKKASVAEGLDVLKIDVVRRREEESAVARARELGASAELAEQIASNEKDRNVILYGTERQQQRLINQRMQMQEPLILEERLLKDIAEAHEDVVDSIDDQIEIHQEIIDAIDEEIEALQKKNDIDQWTIRGKQREIELIDRTIEGLERQNELDQRSIEDLERKDELRLREADALEHDLSLLSETEDKIKKSYDDRIKALNEVFKVNERIAQQQKTQISLAEAITSGDIAAAAQARQQLQSEAAGYARDDMISGLESARDREVAGLTLANGMTREQAEKRIADLKEISYQTSLSIRDIEDRIYARNLDIVKLKDDQIPILNAIRSLEDAIYNRETDIRNIEVSRKQPQEDIIKRLQDQKKDINDIYDAQKDALEQSMLAGQVNSAVADSVNEITTAWGQARKAIIEAQKQARGLESKLVKPVQGSKTYLDDLKKYNEALAKIQKNRDDRINQALSTAQATQAQKAAESTMPHMAMGGRVRGIGMRDSIPTMLTPGEFVVNRASASQHAALLERINNGSFSVPTYRTKGMISDQIGSSFSTNNGNYNSNMYNNTYSVNVNVSNPNASADQIANMTIGKIRELNNKQIRRRSY